MNHATLLRDHERRILESAIGIGRRALDRFERPERRTIRWTIDVALPDSGLINVLRGCRARYLEVSWSSDARRTTMRIHGRDTDLKAPLVEIEEARRIGHHALTPEADEIDAMLVRWASIVRCSRPLDDADHRNFPQRLCRLAILAGAPPSSLEGAIVHAPSIYAEGECATARGREDAHDALRSLLVEPGRSLVMEEDPTCVIASQWWNERIRGRQGRVRFNLSRRRTATLPRIDALDALRLAA